MAIVSTCKILRNELALQSIYHENDINYDEVYCSLDLKSMHKFLTKETSQKKKNKEKVHIERRK